jgi:hypothetical protein
MLSCSDLLDLVAVQQHGVYVTWTQDMISLWYSSCLMLA